MPIEISPSKYRNFSPISSLRQRVPVRKKIQGTVSLLESKKSPVTFIISPYVEFGLLYKAKNPENFNSFK